MMKRTARFSWNRKKTEQPFCLLADEKFQWHNALRYLTKAEVRTFVHQTINFEIRTIREKSRPLASVGKSADFGKQDAVDQW